MFPFCYSGASYGQSIATSQAPPTLELVSRGGRFRRQLLTVTDQLSLRLVPDELWDLVQPHLSKFRPRPQGGGTAPLPGRPVLTAITYMLTSGCA